MCLCALAGTMASAKDADVAQLLRLLNDSSSESVDRLEVEWQRLSAQLGLATEADWSAVNVQPEKRKVGGKYRPKNSAAREVGARKRVKKEEG